MMDTIPSITGNVPAPKAAIKMKPSSELGNAIHEVSARKVSPQGKSPLSKPIAKIELCFLS